VSERLCSDSQPLRAAEFTQLSSGRQDLYQPR
jgi:hypothetical protein